MRTEKLMGCGHPFSAIVSGGEGANYCGTCVYRAAEKRAKKDAAVTDDDFGKDWQTPCIVCGQTPTMPLTEMCGPCTFGEAETMGGNW